MADLDGLGISNFSNWDQYCLSKACCVLMTQALNDRTTNWPAESRETFWNQAVAKTGADFGLGGSPAKL